jgi:hypothetical protein
MTREEAEDLIRRTDGRLCVRFYKRRDGTILTRNCPVGLRAIKERLTGTSAAIIKGLLTLLASVAVMGWRVNSAERFGVLPVTIAQGTEQYTVTTGVLEFPASPAPMVKRSEAFVRDRAILQVTPGPDSSRVSRTKAVVVSIVINEEGEVDEALFVRGDESLRDLAEEAAGHWTFKPVLVKGDPVRVESTLSFRFKR